MYYTIREDNTFDVRSDHVSLTNSVKSKERFDAAWVALDILTHKYKYSSILYFQECGYKAAKASLNARCQGRMNYSDRRGARP